LGELGRVHFIAIGGAGMSGVAAAFLARGLAVSGCDKEDSAALAALADLGASVCVGHDRAHVRGVDTVVVSSAIREDNPELVEARRLGCRVIHRSVALAALMLGCEVVAIAGTHGKTTTTAMCVAALQATGADPSYVIGGTMVDSGQGSHIGDDAVFLVEADESDGTFLQYPTSLAVVTGIEADHLDNWGSPQRYAAGFERFGAADSVRVVVLDADNLGAARLADQMRAQGRQVVTYGEGADCDVRLTDCGLDEGGATAQVSTASWTDRLRLAVPGRHNLHNAAAALAVGEVLDLDHAQVLAGLARFHGTARRFQRVGDARGVTVVDDYAHHPTEVAATLRTAHQMAGAGRVIACFQPHLFSRTQAFADDFGQALAQADEAVVLDVYPAREQPIPGVTGELVAQAVARHGGRVHYVADMDQAVSLLATMARPGDWVLTIGAGSVTSMGPRLLDRLEQS
jgi:UDP-N-acetylmuramate--alanine ligase